MTVLELKIRMSCGLTRLHLRNSLFHCSQDTCEVQTTMVDQTAEHVKNKCKHRYCVKAKSKARKLAAKMKRRAERRRVKGRGARQMRLLDSSSESEGVDSSDPDAEGLDKNGKKTNGAGGGVVTSGAAAAPLAAEAEDQLVPPRWKRTECHQCYSAATCFQDASEAFDADGDGIVDDDESGGFYCLTCWTGVYGKPPKEGGDCVAEAKKVIPVCKPTACHQCHSATTCFQDNSEAHDADGDGKLDEHEMGGFYCEPCWTQVYGAAPEKAPPRWRTTECHQCHSSKTCYQDASEAFDADGDGKFDDHEAGGFYCDTCWTGVYGTPPEKGGDCVAPPKMIPPTKKETGCHQCHTEVICYQDANEAYDADGDGKLDDDEKGGYYCEKCWVEVYGSPPEPGGEAAPIEAADAPPPPVLEALETRLKGAFGGRSAVVHWKLNGTKPNWFIYTS